MARRITLSARPPFSLAAVIRSHGWAQLAPFSRDPHTDRLSYVDRLASGRVVELLIEEAPGGVSVGVETALSPAEEVEVARKVAWMLGLEQDLSAFYALTRAEPRLAHMEGQAQGRILRSPTLFEDVVKTILTTNTAWGGTIRMARALVVHYGDPCPADLSCHAFPTPERLAAADVEALRSGPRLGYRSPYVLGLARAVASGELDLEPLKGADLPMAEVRRRLLAIKGVGGYATANLLMLLGRYDAVPVDSWAVRMVSQEWHGGQAVGPSEVEAAFARWGPWKGLAYWFWDWSLQARE